MTIETINAEILCLQQEVARVERAPPSFDEAWPAVEQALVEAEAVFRRLGPQLGGFVPRLPEHVYERHQAMVGACMVGNKKALIDAERARVKADTAGGISAADKQRRLDELARMILRSAAKRELALRDQEAAHEFRPRPVHPELAIYKRTAVERLARST